MRAKVREAITELSGLSESIDIDEVEETKAFLHWIEDHHFTFLGRADYVLVLKGEETIFTTSIWYWSWDFARQPS